MGTTIARAGCAPAPVPEGATAPARPDPGAAAGGGPRAGALPDIAAALEALRAAVDQLAGVVDAMRSATQIQGGGPGGGAAGCGCGAGSAGSPGTAEQSTRDVMQGARGAPRAGALPPAPLIGTSTAGDGDVRDRIVRAAREELALDVREDRGADDDRAGHIRRYRTAVTGPGEDPNDREPWCADFASYVWKVAGTPFGDGGRGEDSTRAMIDWAKQQGRWTPRAGAEPQRGDLVMIDWGGGSSVNHVAVVTDVSGGRVHTIGGNESDALKSASYPLGDRRLMGYITPSGGSA